MTDKNKNFQTGFTFSKHIPEEVSHFDRVFGIFKDLLIHTSGDLDEAFDWLDMLDKEYDIFNEEYGLDDFIEDLKKRGYIKEEIKPEDGNTGSGEGRNILTAKLEAALRDLSLIHI